MTLKAFKELKSGDRIQIIKWQGKLKSRTGVFLGSSRAHIGRIHLDGYKKAQQFHYIYLDREEIKTHGPGSFGAAVMSGSDIGGV